jgi:uridine phosphorylase
MPVSDAPLALLEDDTAERGVIEPSECLAKRKDMPARVVMCFFAEVVESLAARGDARKVAVLTAAHGKHPIYEVVRNAERLAVFHPGVGAPLAAGFLEEAIALGGRAFVAVGGAGALVPELALGHAIVVASAVRDEGTSFHYLPPGRIVEADPAGVIVLENTLRNANVPFVTGRTWTTDAIYRETRARVARRVAEGCIAVDMEAAAFIAVAKFRGVAFAQLLYAGDSLAGDAWDARSWTSVKTIREELFWQAADACRSLPLP